MRRREVLAAAAAATLPLAGCSTLTGPTTLGSPTVETGDRETHLQWRREGERVTLSIRQQTVPEMPTDPFGLRLHVSHGEGLHVEYLQFRINAPREPGTIPATVSLQIPDGGPWPPFTLHQEEWATVAVEDLDELGRGSLGLELGVHPRSDPVETVTVDASIGLTGAGLLGGEYRARAAEEFDVVHGTDP